MLSQWYWELYSSHCPPSPQSCQPVPGSYDDTCSMSLVSGTRHRIAVALYSWESLLSLGFFSVSSAELSIVSLQPQYQDKAFQCYQCFPWKLIDNLTEGRETNRYLVTIHESEVWEFDGHWHLGPQFVNVVPLEIVLSMLILVILDIEHLLDLQLGAVVDGSVLPGQLLQPVAEVPCRK